MKPDYITLAVVFGGLAALIAYDVWTLIKRGYNTTISANALLLAGRYPIIAFALGVVVGHMWWPHGDCVK